MKYCSKCGKQLEDDAVVCIGCGRLVCDQYQNRQSCTPSTLSNVAKIFMIIATVVSGIFTLGIALAWCLPMTLSYNKKIKNGINVSIGFKVCSLLFVSLIAGILMLCDEN